MEDNQIAEDERKAEELAEELAKKMAEACSGYSYRCIGHATSRLLDRAFDESVFTWKASSKSNDE